jgi:hypothetical protein
MLIAAAYANAGKVKEMDAAIARADAIHQPEDYDLSDGFACLLEDLALQGDDATLERLMTKYLKAPENRDFPYLHSARGHLRRGGFAKAFEQASKIRRLSHLRQRLQAEAVYRRIAKDLAGAEAAFATIRSPIDRAIVALTVADLVNGKRVIGEQILGDYELD